MTFILYKFIFIIFNVRFIHERNLYLIYISFRLFGADLLLYLTCIFPKILIIFDYSYWLLLFEFFLIIILRNLSIWISNFISFIILNMNTSNGIKLHVILLLTLHIQFSTLLRNLRRWLSLIFCRVKSLSLLYFLLYIFPLQIFTLSTNLNHIKNTNAWSYEKDLYGSHYILGELK